MRILVFLLFCTCSVAIQAQSLIQQAQELRQNLTPIEGGQKAKVPSNGAKAAKTKKLLDKYLLVYRCEDGDTNPFINCDDEAWIQVGPLFQELDESATRKVGAPFLPELPGGTGSTVTNIADGLARFLVKRTKEELSIAFFRKFKDKLESDTYMQSLFPSTKGVLLTIDNQIYFYQAYLGSLRTAFDQDLKNMPIHLRSTLEQTNIIKNEMSSILVEDLLGAAQLQIEGQPAPEFFRFFAQDASIQDMNRVAQLGARKDQVHDLAMGLKLAYLLSESLRSNNPTGSPWLSRTEIREILSDPITFHLYLGLLWQNGGDIKFSNGTTFRGLLSSVSNVGQKKENIRQQVLRLSEYGAEITRGIDSVFVHPEGQISYDKYYPVIDGSLHILEQGIQFRSLINSTDTSGQKLAGEWIDQLQHFQDLSYYIRQRNYVNAVMQIIAVLDYFCKDNISKAALLKYGTFIASVAEADSAEEVEKAIELFALPPGSSSLKKQSPFSISLNAYSGLSYGQERLTNVPTANQDGQVVSVSAPVGLAFNVGMKKVGSLSLYTSVIDIGALTAYRFQDPNSNDLPDLKWSNIIAPGAFLIYGAPAYLPLSIGAGIQAGPNLRSVNAPIQTTRAIRGIIFLNVDIPITYFYN